MKTGLFCEGKFSLINLASDNCLSDSYTGRSILDWREPISANQQAIINIQHYNHTPLYFPLL